MKRSGKKIQPISIIGLYSAQILFRKFRFIKFLPDRSASSKKSPLAEQEMMANRHTLSAAGNQWPGLLRTCINILLIIVAVIAGLGLINDKNNYLVPAGFRQGRNSVYEIERPDSAAKAVEEIFSASDTNQLAKILSPVTLEKRRPYFPQLIEYMSAFAADFKTRKLQLVRARYAVYEFKSLRGKFLVEFCTDSSGRWVLMNF